MKELLKEARLKLLSVQEIVRPISPLYFELDEIIGKLEVMITNIKE